MASKRCPACGETKPLSEFPGKKTKGSYCKPCFNAYYRERRRDDPEYKRKQREWWRNNKDKARKYKRRTHLRMHYDLTVEEYDAMAEAQDGKCAICLTEPSRDVLYVDHDHGNGRTRGLLCAKCNFAVGQMDDDPERLRAAAAYVENYRLRAVKNDNN